MADISVTVQCGDRTQTIKVTNVDAPIEALRGLAKGRLVDDAIVRCCRPLSDSSSSGT